MRTILYVRANGIYNDSRATKEILSFLKNGYRVYIVGWDREGDSNEKCTQVFSHYINNIKLFMFSFKIKDHVGFKNITKLLRWLRYVNGILNENAKDIDVVHACNLDSILFCYKKCKKDGIKIVYDIFDYYVDNHALIPKFLKPIIELMEINIINNSDITIICTDERRIQIAKAKPNKIIVVHNSPEVEEVKNDIKYDYFYCGTFCPQRLLEEILDGYENNDDLIVGFAGSGLYRDLANRIDKEYANFSYYGPVTYKECLEYESQAICLAAIYEPTIRNHKLCAPNKFYESMALGKPIIVCRGSGIDRIVEEYNIGIVINYRVEEFYEAIRMLKNNVKLCAEMGMRARTLYLQKYKWSIMEKILLDAYDSLF